MTDGKTEMILTSEDREKTGRMKEKVSINR